MSSGRSGGVIEPRIRYLILLMLAARPMHGYELIKALRSLFSFASISPGPGTVYPVLHRLVEEGLVEYRLESRAGKRLKVYGLTRRGVEELAGMIVKAFRISEALLRLHVEAVRGLCGSGSLGLVPELRRAVEDVGRVISSLLSVLSGCSG